MTEIKPKKIIEKITNIKTGEQYLSDEEWKSKGIAPEDIKRDVTVIMPSLDLFGKTKQDRQMAITRSQIAKQLLAKGGRIGLVRGGRRGDTGQASQSESRSFGGAGDEPQRDTGLERQRQRTIAREQRIKDLENLIDRPTFGFTDAAKFNLSPMPIRILQGLGRIDLSGPTQLAGLKSDDRFGGRDETSNRLLFSRMAQGPRTMDTMLTEEDEEKKEPEMFRYLAKGGMADEVVGGEMDFESARQMYGLGKLVKKATRTIKKIAKSPIGKAALLYGAGSLGMAGLGQFRAGTGIFSPTGFLKSRALPFLVGTGGTPRPPTKGILGAGGIFDPFKTILGASVLAGLTAKEEEDDTTVKTANLGPGLTIPDKQYRLFQEGGSTEKEPVAKKTMPLLDMGGMEKDYREDGGFVPIGRMEKADDVPARLSKNEFVFTADAVRNAGDGDVDKGAEVMYNMMKNLEAGGEVSEESQGLEGARKMFQTSQRLEEVL